MTKKSELSLMGQMKREAERDFNKFIKYVAELEKENKELKYKINKFLRLYKKGHSDSLFDYVETLSYEKY